MAIFRLGEHVPQVDPSAYVAEATMVVGQAHLAENTSVWTGAVIRADNEPVRVGKGSNVQEGAVLHVDPGFPLNVGEGVVIGHQAMLHGCTVGDGSLVGIQAVILNGAEIGPESLVGAGALVTEGKKFPARSLIMGTPAKLVRTLSDDEVAKLRWSAEHYVERAQLFKSELVRVA